MDCRIKGQKREHRYEIRRQTPGARVRCHVDKLRLEADWYGAICGALAAVSLEIATGTGAVIGLGFWFRISVGICHVSVYELA